MWGASSSVGACNDGMTPSSQYSNPWSSCLQVPIMLRSKFCSLCEGGNSLSDRDLAEVGEDPYDMVGGDDDVSHESHVWFTWVGCIWGEWRCMAKCGCDLGMIWKALSDNVMWVDMWVTWVTWVTWVATWKSVIDQSPTPNFQGGYFVINGSEKVLIAQVWTRVWDVTPICVDWFLSRMHNRPFFHSLLSNGHIGANGKQPRVRVQEEPTEQVLLCL